MGINIAALVWRCAVVLRKWPAKNIFQLTDRKTFLIVMKYQVRFYYFIPGAWDKDMPYNILHALACILVPKLMNKPKRAIRSGS